MHITNNEMAQASIEIFGGFACLIFVVIIIMNRQNRKSMNAFKWMFMVTAGLFLSEACAYVFRGNTDTLSVVLTRVSNFAVFLLNVVLANLFVHYVCLVLEEKGVKDDNKKLRMAALLCLVGVLAILLLNIPTKWMYYFDAANYYHRNAGWYVYTGINLMCIFIGLFAGFRHRKEIGKGTFGALILYTCVPLVTIVLQSFIYGISLSNLGLAFSLLVMLITYLLEWSKADYMDATESEKRSKSVEIFILFILMVIVMSTSIISCILSIRRISQQNSQGNSMVIAHMVEDAVETELLKPLTVSKTMAYDSTLQALLKRSNSEGAESVVNEMKSYLNSIRNGMGYQMVFAVAEDSKAYYTYHGISKIMDLENDPHDIWYKQIRDCDKRYELNVDTDEDNHWALSVFVNMKMYDDNGIYIGACGTGVNMQELQNLIAEYEQQYKIKINLVKASGEIQIDSDGEKIENAYLEADYFDKVTSKDFYYEELALSSRMTRYLKDYDWYLVVEDLNPDKMNIMAITMPSIFIFAIGLIIMGVAFTVISTREQKTAKELEIRKNASITDELTGLFNRRAYEEECERIVAGKDMEDCIVVMLDVNGLKFANDNLGHAAGDELIIGAANCMMTTFGGHGKVYRVGGDEFVVLMHGTREKLDDALKTFDHVTSNWKGKLIQALSISKGSAVCAEHPEMSFDEIKELADKLMYEDKDEYYRRTGKVRRK